MVKNSRSAIFVLVASAAVAAGCSGNKDEVTGTVEARRVSLTGCVSSGVGNQQLMLTQVRFAQPGDASSYAGTGITEHSQVRLAIKDDAELLKLVGQVASVTGSLKDDGRNTIGTSGPAAGPNDPEPRTDRSAAAEDKKHAEKVADEAGPIGQRSLNNGTFPEVAVDHITATGQKCPTLR